MNVPIFAKKQISSNLRNMLGAATRWCHAISTSKNCYLVEHEVQIKS